MRDLAQRQTVWRMRPCCPLPVTPTWRDRINIFAVVCRRISRNKQQVVFEQMDDRLLDDIGIDGKAVRRMTVEQKEALRRLRRAAYGGFF